ncbi:MAG TPA: hypothetical protein DD618_04925, partial [Acholeplasmatales bacterium]|nr:hypothetical protein [Acholeplasmatales bacterium]
KGERNLLIIGAGVMLLFFLTLTIGAVVSGLAHGETEMNTLAWVLSRIAMGAFSFGQIGAGIAGLMLLRKQFSQPPKPAE